ncbi:MAG: PaaI family thioesterase [Clostridia bacterium]
MNINKIKEYFLADKFCAENGILIKELNNDFCICEVKIEERHLNAGNVAQGGLIFTLGDFAFAVHANSEGMTTVSQGADINYLKPGRGNYLFAKATPISRTARTAIYNVDITNEIGTLVAQMTVRGFVLGENPFLKETL